MENLRTGEKIAGAAGVLLLVIMFVFNWFNVSGEVGGLEGSTGVNAWEAFSVIDIVLFITAVAAIALAVVSATQTQVNLPVAMSALVAGLGVLATILVLIRIIDPPNLNVPDVDLLEDLGVSIGRSIGVWLGLIASAAIAYGGWQAMQEDGPAIPSGHPTSRPEPSSTAPPAS
jgi:hypothetical protein